jgi:hypothetical protein
LKKNLLATVAAIIIVVAFLPASLGGLVGYYYVVSGSMEPLIPVGSLIITHPAWLRPPRIGDVVVYRSDSLGLIAHRLVGFEDGEYVLRADVGGYVEKVWPGRVIGVAVVIIPLMGWVGIAASLNPALYILLATLLAVSLMPGRPSRLLYPASAVMGLLPSILPLKPGTAFLGPYTGLIYSCFFTAGSAASWISFKRGLIPLLAEIVCILICLASASVVNLPWLG